MNNIVGVTAKLAPLSRNSVDLLRNVLLSKKYVDDYGIFPCSVCGKPVVNHRVLCKICSDKCWNRYFLRVSVRIFNEFGAVHDAEMTAFGRWVHIPPRSCNSTKYWTVVKKSFVKGFKYPVQAIRLIP